jgi:L,D-peptidoglycan transpeptidase YkuD (ErfK/YbiS/YcfS/YnhG family)
MIKKPLLATSLSFIAVFVLIAVYFSLSLTPSKPLEKSGQLILVVSQSDNSDKATLYFFTKSAEGWKFDFSFPAVIGRNGMAWGIGLHKNADHAPGDPVKKEGDGKTPEGAYGLIKAYGYPPPNFVRIKFPYEQTTKDLICIDDVKSKYYNMMVKVSDKNLDPAKLPSHEDMLREDNLYKYVVFVAHNTSKPKKGAGSCIFLHIWQDEKSNTAGCTAMSEESMLRLLSSLDPEKKPVLVQLTRNNYLRLKEIWGLPDLNI